MVVKVAATTEERHNNFYVGGKNLLEELEKANHSEKEKFAKDFNQRQREKCNQIKKEKAQK